MTPSVLLRLAVAGVGLFGFCSASHVTKLKTEAEALSALAYDHFDMDVKPERTSLAFIDCMRQVLPFLSGTMIGQAALLYRLDWQLTQVLISDAVESTKKTLQAIDELLAFRHECLLASHPIVAKSFSIITHPLFNQRMGLPNTTAETWAMRHDWRRAQWMAQWSPPQWAKCLAVIYRKRAYMSLVALPLVDSEADRFSLYYDYDAVLTGEETSHAVALYGMAILSRPHIDLSFVWRKILVANARTLTDYLCVVLNGLYPGGSTAFLISNLQIPDFVRFVVAGVGRSDHKFLPMLVLTAPSLQEETRLATEAFAVATNAMPFLPWSRFTDLGMQDLLGFGDYCLEFLRGFFDGKRFADAATPQEMRDVLNALLDLLAVPKRQHLLKYVESFDSLVGCRQAVRQLLEMFSLNGVLLPAPFARVIDSIERDRNCFTNLLQSLLSKPLSTEIGAKLKEIESSLPEVFMFTLAEPTRTLFFTTLHGLKCGKAERSIRYRLLSFVVRVHSAWGISLPSELAKIFSTVTADKVADSAAVEPAKRMMTTVALWLRGKWPASFDAASSFAEFATTLPTQSTTRFERLNDMHATRSTMAPPQTHMHFAFNEHGMSDHLKLIVAVSTALVSAPGSRLHLPSPQDLQAILFDPASSQGSQLRTILRAFFPFIESRDMLVRNKTIAFLYNHLQANVPLSSPLWLAHIQTLWECRMAKMELSKLPSIEQALLAKFPAYPTTPSVIALDTARMEILAEHLVLEDWRLRTEPDFDFLLKANAWFQTVLRHRNVRTAAIWTFIGSLVHLDTTPAGLQRPRNRRLGVPLLETISILQALPVQHVEALHECMNALVLTEWQAVDLLPLMPRSNRAYFEAKLRLAGSLFRRSPTTSLLQAGLALAERKLEMLPRFVQDLGVVLRAEASDPTLPFNHPAALERREHEATWKYMGAINDLVQALPEPQKLHSLLSMEALSGSHSLSIIPGITYSMIKGQAQLALAYLSAYDQLVQAKMMRRTLPLPVATMCQNVRRLTENMVRVYLDPNPQISNAVYGLIKIITLDTDGMMKESEAFFLITLPNGERMAKAALDYLTTADPYINRREQLPALLSRLGSLL